MKKLVILNVVGLVVAIGLAAVLLANAKAAKQVTANLRAFTVVEVQAGEISSNMIAMSDAMRGYLLDTSNTAEAERKEAADAALVKAVEVLLAATDDAEYRKLATEIGELDETQLDRIEDEIIATAKTDAPAATKPTLQPTCPSARSRWAWSTNSSAARKRTTSARWPQRTRTWTPRSRGLSGSAARSWS